MCVREELVSEGWFFPLAVEVRPAVYWPSPGLCHRFGGDLQYLSVLSGLLGANNETEYNDSSHST